MSCTVILTIRAESTAWGETVGVTGSIAELSSWGATTPPSLTASPFPIWTTTLTLPAETVVQYKYVILASSQIARWEALPSSEENRSFVTPAPGDTLTIHDGTMGFATRTSATVTPSTSPATTPTRPQRPKVTAESTIETLQTPQPDQHSLAEFAVQLDHSRRQVEHVRAAVRRIRRIPTPDALPTPPTTPDESTDLSRDAAAALVTDTLSEAKVDVDVIRHKLRALRAGRSQPAKWGSKLAVLAGALSFAVALLAICVAVIDPIIGGHRRRVVGVAGGGIVDGDTVAGKIVSFRERSWAEECWYAGVRGKIARASVESWQAIERARMKLGRDWLAPLSGVCKDAADRAGIKLRKIERAAVESWQAVERARMKLGRDWLAPLSGVCKDAADRAGVELRKTERAAVESWQAVERARMKLGRDRLAPLSRVFRDAADRAGEKLRTLVARVAELRA